MLAVTYAVFSDIASQRFEPGSRVGQYELCGPESASNSEILILMTALLRQLPGRVNVPQVCGN
jgi:hypothetical protein